MAQLRMKIRKFGKYCGMFSLELSGQGDCNGEPMLVGHDECNIASTKEDEVVIIWLGVGECGGDALI